jgi:serine/threonine protein kinase
MDDTCKVIISNDPVMKGYCITTKTMQTINPEKSLYQLPHTKFHVDKNSIEIFSYPDYKAFILIPKMVGNIQATLDGVKIYALRPLRKDDKDRYERNDMKDNELTIQYEPIKYGVSSGSYGSFDVDRTQRLGIKNSTRVTDDGDLPQDIVKEIAIYQLLKNCNATQEKQCLPGLIGFNVDPYKSLKLELGIGTMRDFIYTMSEEKEYYTVMERILGCMYNISKQGIIHADLKPDNIILNVKGETQIIDWGIAEIDYSAYQEKKKNTNIQTIYYRSPEILLYNLIVPPVNEGLYSNKVDIFSLGLIFCELFSKKIAVPTRTAIEQSRALLSILLDINAPRIPSEIEKMLMDNISGGSLQKIIYNQLRNHPNFRNNKNEQMPEKMAEIISSMLEFNPKFRASYQTLLRKPILGGNCDNNKILINKIPIRSSLSSFWPKDVNREKILNYMKDLVVSLYIPLEVFCLAIQLMDLYIYKKFKYPSEEILARATLLISNKLLESYDLNMDGLSLNHRTIVNIINLEKKILTGLKGNLLYPTLYTYYVRDENNPQEKTTLDNILKYISYYLQDDVYINLSAK